ncbi:BAG domain-containing protein [Heracleum sosnowskyi]|uniref:BAG domain-containing protein n=1 Tax=Heracleum sosnowskyi TaxID=360622 RepID=A0AAD8HFF2_9APIA|nr:BAG domain-containing protein [Heracleum sosnowskyi]
MASPFFSSYWNQPSESRYSPSCIPLKRKPEIASPKVISIPVHFVASENNRVNSGLNRSGSALKIQKDSKERLRINETLMALLFKLDSVRGIDSGVRELRKGVIRKAIALQEKVDALVMLPPDSIKSDGGEIVVDHPIRGDEMPIEISPPAVSIDEMPTENVVDSIKSECGEIMEDHPICDDEVPIENEAESMDLLNDDQEEGNCVVKECNTMNSKTEIQKEDEDMDDCCKGVQQAEEEEETWDGDNEKMMREEAGEKKSNEELQTQMIRMMSELVEKNEMQTRMINSLTHRVGQLEKALLCDKLRRTNKKKKRQHDAAAYGKQQ